MIKKNVDVVAREKGLLKLKLGGTSQSRCDHANK
jgi:hypothetical protein